MRDNQNSSSAYDRLLEIIFGDNENIDVEAIKACRLQMIQSRRKAAMLISGSSKAGKSFLLMELCIAIAEGKPWLGFPCKKGRVLYTRLTAIGG